MTKRVETTINRFDGGIDNDPRAPFEGSARMISHFDTYTNPRKLIPYRSTESGDDAPTTSKKRRFTALRVTIGGTTKNVVYALGVQSGTSNPQILYKDLTNSGAGANDLGDNTWSAPGNNNGSATSVQTECFVFYAKQTRLYFGKSLRYITDMDPQGSAAEGGNITDLTSYTTIAQGIVHSKDDILYIPYDNKIAKNNAGTWTNAALTLPTHFVITSICEYGDYIAVGARHIAGIGSSRVFLWDRDSTLTTLSENIDWGEGTLRVLEEIEGDLIGITDKAVSYAFNFNTSLIFKRYRFGMNAAQIITILQSDGTTNSLSADKQKIDNRLFFGGRFKFNGAVREGIFSIGRGNSPTGYTIVHEQLVNNDTALTDSTNSEITGFLKVGDHWFISYKDNSTEAVSKTVANNVGTASRYLSYSIYEKRFATEGSGKKKDLVGVTVTYEYLPADASVELFYRTDQNTSWTQIMVDSTDNSISKSAVTADTDGDGDYDAGLPKDYKEIEFRIRSRGAAEITSLSFMEDVTDKRPYG